ncbi:MAG: hypothetical protein WC763_05170 [Candidatus Paceibacterota bacterium]|jgi:hypothetical protein
MSDEITDVQPSETAEGTETLETPATPTDEDVLADAQGDTETSENQEGDEYYKEQLKQLQEENDQLKAEADERKRQVELKDRAIEAQKKKLKMTATSGIDVSSLKAEVLQDIRLDATIEAHASSDAEAKLIRHHLDHSIVRTGDPRKDVQNAKALANAARVNEILSRDNQEDEREARSIASMSGGNARGPAGSRPKPAHIREAEKLLPKEMHKYLNN